jgi:hypothetical protein
MSKRKRYAIMMVGVIPLGLLVGYLSEAFDIYVLIPGIVALFLYQAIVQTWAMTGEWIWKWKRPGR